MPRKKCRDLPPGKYTFFKELNWTQNWPEKCKDWQFSSFRSQLASLYIPSSMPSNMYIIIPAGLMQSFLTHASHVHFAQNFHVPVCLTYLYPKAPPYTIYSLENECICWSMNFGLTTVGHLFIYGYHRYIPIIIYKNIKFCNHKNTDLPSSDWWK